MKRRPQNRIKLDWAHEPAFRVPLNRVIPRARRVPDTCIDFFLPPEEEAWRNLSFIL